MSEKYNPRTIEAKWQSFWIKNSTFKSELSNQLNKPMTGIG